MSAYKIEHNVPVPEHNHSKPGFVPLLRSMKVGDSVLVAKGAMPSIRSVARIYKIKVLCRAVSSTEARVWRVAGPNE